MRIVLTKLTDERHRLELVRADGTREAAELETRSTLLHDLVHYAVEAEGAFARGFFGSFASGKTLAELSGAMTSAAPDDAELALVERLVGPLQSLWKGALDPARYVEHAAVAAPGIVDAAFVARVLARLRSLVGRWRATPYRAAMELEWPPG